MARPKRHQTPPAPPKEVGKPVEQDAPKQPSEPVVGTPPASEAKPKANKRALPDSVTLSAPHGFIDEDGSHRYWHAGHVVTDPEHVALLIKRKAPLEGVEHDES